MTTTVFAVDTDPYCLWGHPADSHNLEFLKGIDAEYFSWVGRSHRKEQEETNPEPADTHRAATAARLALHQGIETMFSLIGGMLQAPDAVYAWIGKCRTETIREIVEKITEEKFNSPMRLKGPVPTWDLLAQFSLEASHDAEDTVIAAATGFGQLWKRLASEFIDTSTAQEYNSLKHGFRVAAGGFKIEILDKSSEPGAPNQSITLGESRHGVSFFEIRKIEGDEASNRSIRAHQRRRNWDAEQTSLLLDLVAASIRNIVSTLQVISGMAKDDVIIVLPSAEAFLAPWQTLNALRCMSMDRNLPGGNARKTTKAELNELLRIRQAEFDSAAEGDRSSL